MRDFTFIALPLGIIHKFDYSLCDYTLFTTFSTGLIFFFNLSTLYSYWWIKSNKTMQQFTSNLKALEISDI